MRSTTKPKLCLLRSNETSDADRALDALATVLLPRFEKLLDQKRVESERVDIGKHISAEKTRTVSALCRRGVFPSAAKVARRWTALRSEVDAWLRTRGPRAIESDDDDDEFEDLRRDLARAR